MHEMLDVDLTSPSSTTSSILVSPNLYVHGISCATDDQAIMDCLRRYDCLRARPFIDRSTDLQGLASGYLEFEEMSKAEKAYAVCQGHLFGDSTLNLSMSAQPELDPVPQARPILLKQVRSPCCVIHIFLIYRNTSLATVHREPFGTLRFSPRLWSNSLLRYSR